MTEFHHCIRCTRCQSTDGCPEGNGTICESCGWALCEDCACPNRDCEAAA